MRKIEKVEPLSKIGNPKPNSPNNFSSNQNNSDEKDFSNFLQEYAQKKEEEKGQEDLVQDEESKTLVLTRHFVSPSKPKIDSFER